MSAKKTKKVYRSKPGPVPRPELRRVSMNSSVAQETRAWLEATAKAESEAGVRTSIGQVIDRLVRQAS